MNSCVMSSASAPNIMRMNSTISQQLLPPAVSARLTDKNLPPRRQSATVFHRMQKNHWKTIYPPLNVTRYAQYNLQRWHYVFTLSVPLSRCLSVSCQHGTDGECPRSGHRPATCQCGTSPFLCHHGLARKNGIVHRPFKSITQITAGDLQLSIFANTKQYVNYMEKVENSHYRTILNFMASEDPTSLF